MRLTAFAARSVGALLAIDAAQHRMLRSETSFDIVFDRVEWAIYGWLLAACVRLWRWCFGNLFAVPLRSVWPCRNAL